MAEVLTLPGCKDNFVVGLSWWLEKSKPTAKVLRGKASKARGRWAAVREADNGKFQTGYCAPITRVKSPASLRSLAAIVANAHPNPWRGLFEIAENRYWYVAVRDNHGIIQEGDLVGTLEQLEPVRARHAEVGEWTDVTGNLRDLAAIVRAASASAGPIARLVDGLRRAQNLRDLEASPRKAWGAMGAALAVVGVGVGSYLVWHERQLEEQRQQENARKRAAEDALAAKRSAEAKILPWTQMPMPAEVYDTCAQAWHSQKLARRGWLLANWHCKALMQSVMVEATWSRAGGLATDAPGMLSPDGESSSTSDSLPTAFSAPSSHALPSEDARRLAWATAQASGIKLNLQAAPKPPVLPGATPANNTAPVDPWIGFPLDFAAPFAPWFAHTEPLGSVPALRISEVSYEVTANRWSVAGMLYGLRGVVTASAAAGGRPAQSPSTGGVGLAPAGGRNGNL